MALCFQTLASASRSRLSPGPWEVTLPLLLDNPQPRNLPAHENQGKAIPVSGLSGPVRGCPSSPHPTVPPGTGPGVHHLVCALRVLCTPWLFSLGANQVVLVITMAAEHVHLTLCIHLSMSARTGAVLMPQLQQNLREDLSIPAGRLTSSRTENTICHW